MCLCQISQCQKYPKQWNKTFPLLLTALIQVNIITYAICHPKRNSISSNNLGWNQGNKCSSSTAIGYGRQVYTVHLFSVILSSFSITSWIVHLFLEVSYFPKHFFFSFSPVAAQIHQSHWHSIMSSPWETRKWHKFQRGWGCVLNTNLHREEIEKEQAVREEENEGVEEHWG